MTRPLLLAVLLLFLAGCEPDTLEKLNAMRQETVEWTASRCGKRSIDGVECVICRSSVYGGWNVAVSCDWSNASNDAPIEGHAFKFKNKHYDPNTAPLKVWDNAPYSAPSFEENPSLSERR